MEFEEDLKLGPIGELTFSEWCAKAQITCNRSTDEDKTGWDHYLEFPYLKTNLPRDKQPSPIECKVQVKSTQRKDRNLSIKVSVLKRLIDYSYPTFTLFLEFTKESEPTLENAFLVHIDKKIIERVLKKIRQNDTHKNPKNLYEIKISISYNQKNLLPNNSGTAFKERVLSYIPKGDIDKYQEEKRHLLKNIGYGKSGYIIKFNTSPKELDLHILESAIGTSTPLNVTNHTILDNRFDVKNGSVEVEYFEQAKLIISSNIKETCTIRFKESNHSPSINFKADFIPVRQILGSQKLIFKTPLFSLELNNINEKKSMGAKLHLTIEGEAELDEVIKLFKLFQYNNKNIICEIEWNKDKGIVASQFKIDHGYPDTRNIINSIEQLKNIYDIDGKTILTVDELYNQRENLLTLTSIFNNNVDDITINIPEESEEYPDEIERPVSLVIPIGMQTIGVIFLLHAKKKNNNSYQAYKFEVLDKLSFNNETPTLETINSLVSETLKRLEEK